jgi:flavin reductase (DIM6/NTAB) family NADH-FMN oxidoreductase RutF
MKHEDYMQVANEAMDQIRVGAFLTVKAGEALNTMTIGWATIGVVWSRPIFMVAVRLSRHTFSLIEKADDFTVAIPATGTMEDELTFCGTQSGRDYDKFEECNLPVALAQKVSTPIIQVPGLHYECQIIYTSAMAPAFFSRELDENIYPARDYHTLYFGHIVDCYRIEGG